MKYTIAAALACAIAAAPTRAASLDVTVNDARGAAIEDAVVHAMPKSGMRTERLPRTASIVQKDKRFVPRVTVVQVGTSVQFPNGDPFRHHVYSFSPARIFEIKLYAGTPAAPVVFDKPGEVVLGCNIHDDMVGYLLVVDSPHFAKTDREGRARIDGLAAGDFDVHVWHFAQSAPVPSRSVTARGAESIAVSASIALKTTPIAGAN